MKSFKYILSLGLGLFAGSVLWAGELVEKASTRKVNVYNGAGVTIDLLNDVHTFVAKHSRLEFNLKGLWEGEFKTIEAVDAPTHPDDFATLLIINATTNVSALTVDPEKKLAVINFSRIDTADTKKLSRRLERLYMRGIAQLAGIEACPNIQCCLFDYPDVELIDTTGRNFCPPCDMRYDAQMKELNVPLPDPRELFMQKMKEMQKRSEQPQTP